MADATWNALRAGIEALREYTDTCEALDAMEAALAAQQPAQGEAGKGDDMVLVPRDLLGAAAGAIRNPQHSAHKTLEKLRRYVSAPPAPSVSVPMAPPVVFAEWLRSNMPPDTIISDPDWWAMAIWSAARRAINAAPVAPGGKASLPGWKLVPTEPTAAMLKHTHAGRASYAALLAAAPEPPK